MGKKAQPISEILKILNSYVSGYSIDEKTTPKLNVWSLKKVLILYDYVKPFLTILRSWNYKKIHYYDPFAGTGFFRVNDKIMTGTPLTPLLATRELVKSDPRLFFDSFNYSDVNKQSLDVLKNRAEELKDDLQTQINVELLPFRNVALTKFKDVPPLPQNKKNDAYLIMLDPYGYDVEWKYLERILKGGAVDVILTFPSELANWTKTMENSQEKFTKMFGGEEYKEFDSAEDFVKNYCEKIRNIPVVNKPPLGTEAITVEAGRKTYHLICISGSGGAMNVFSSMQKKYGNLTSKDMENIFNEALGTGLSDFF